MTEIEKELSRVLIAQFKLSGVMSKNRPKPGKNIPRDIIEKIDEMNNGNNHDLNLSIYGVMDEIWEMVNYSLRRIGGWTETYTTSFVRGKNYQQSEYRPPESFGMGKKTSKEIAAKILDYILPNKEKLEI